MYIIYTKSKAGQPKQKCVIDISCLFQTFKAKENKNLHAKGGRDNGLLQNIIQNCKPMFHNSNIHNFSSQWVRLYKHAPKLGSITNPILVENNPVTCLFSFFHQDRHIVIWHKYTLPCFWLALKCKIEISITWDNSILSTM